MDYDNDMLYTTSTGLEATRLYDGAASAFPDGFVMAPNGCYVRDAVVYMVNMNYIDGAAGVLGTYDIATGELAYDAVVLGEHSRCDGIVYYDGFWFVTDVGQGQLLALNTEEEDGIFEVVLEDMPGAAD